MQWLISQHEQKCPYGQEVNTTASFQSHDEIKSIQKPEKIVKPCISVMGLHLKNKTASGIDFLVISREPVSIVHVAFLFIMMNKYVHQRHENVLIKVI